MLHFSALHSLPGEFGKCSIHRWPVYSLPGGDTALWGDGLNVLDLSDDVLDGYTYYENALLGYNLPFVWFSACLRLH